MVPSNAIQIRRAEIGTTVVQQLIGALNNELEARYPEEGREFLPAGRGGGCRRTRAFLVAYIDGRPVACGAVRLNEPGVAEIKRMYVAPEARGRGVGRLVLDELEAVARQLGVQRLVLETGPRQPEALALYRRAGFVEIPLFGEYVGAEFSVCMAKDL